MRDQRLLAWIAPETKSANVCLASSVVAADDERTG
jgi:hypothetical protein